MSRLTLGVLGSLQVMAGQVPITAFESDKVRALLVYLAVEPYEPHRRGALLGLLWPDSPEEVARRNLRQALYNLRQAIGDYKANPPYLLVTREEIQFNPASDHALDVSTFNTLLDTCDEHLPRCVQVCSIHAARLEEAITLYRGPFLHEFFLQDSAEFEEWAVQRREAFHRRALEALTYLANYSELGGEYERAQRWASRLLELDPWREEAHCQLMRVLAARGERSAALAQFEACRRVLTRELGVEPSAETRDLYEQIKRGEPARLKGFTSSQSTWSPPGLPAQTTPFIGRERELQDLSRLLTNPECRLLTLVGPGGIGKTRLALQAAAAVRPNLAHGAAFVSLAPVETPAFIVTALADAVGFQFSGPADPKTQLWNLLRNKELLLVLDNVEHLLAEGPPEADASGLIAGILEHAPHVKLLVTSRELLNLQGEWVFEVQGLQVLQDKQDDAFGNSSAVALFLQRAHRSHLGFALQPDERQTVVRICRLLGGMPLAIELAAAWVRVLPLVQIEREIEQNLDFLATSMRDLPERHRSIRTVFDYSWQLLSAEERAVLARLSVFRGGFERKAAEAIAGASLVVLSALISKSFIRRLPDGRYELHELVRQYASERLHENPAEETIVRDRHSDFFLTWLGQCEIGLTSRRQRATIAEITLDLDNLRLAWERAAEQHQLDRLRQVAFPMFWFYELRNLLGEGESAFWQAVQGATLQDTRDPAEQGAASISLAHLQAFQAHFLHRQSRNSEAFQMLEQSLVVLRDGLDWAALAETLWIYGTACWMVGDLERASQHFDQALALEREVKRAWALADGHISIGYLEFERGNYAESERWLRQGLALSRAVGDPTLTAFGIAGLCRVLKRSRQLSEMELLLREAYRLAQESGNGLAVGLSLEELAESADVRGDRLQARRFCQESIALYRQTGDEWSLSRALNRLGTLELASNAAAEARQSFMEALGIAFQGSYSTNLSDALYGIAAIEAKVGRRLLALELVLLILNDPSTTIISKGLAEKLRAQLDIELPQEEIQAAAARVQGETLEDVVQIVLAG